MNNGQTIHTTTLAAAKDAPVGAMLTATQLKAIRELLAVGETAETIASDLKLSVGAVQRAAKRMGIDGRKSRRAAAQEPAETIADIDPETGEVLTAKGAEEPVEALETATEAAPEPVKQVRRRGRPRTVKAAETAPVGSATDAELAVIGKLVLTAKLAGMSLEEYVAMSRAIITTYDKFSSALNR